MARLPVPGSDNGTWGGVLNDFLSVEHNPDGTLKAGGSLSSKLSATDLPTTLVGEVSSNTAGYAPNDGFNTGDVYAYDEFSAVAVGDTAYLFGGYLYGQSTGSSGYPYNVIIVNMLTGEATKGPQYPEVGGSTYNGDPSPWGFEGGYAAYINGKFYFGGGDNNMDDSSPDNTSNSNGTTYELDLTGNVFTRKAQKPTPVEYTGSCTYGNKMYVLGGYTETGVNGVTPTFEVYDPSSDTWTQLADAPLPISENCLAAVDGKIYVLNGAVYDVLGDWQQGDSFHMVYDIQTDSWSDIAKCPRNIGSCTAVVRGTDIYMAGGWGIYPDNDSNKTVYKYDTLTDIWEEAGSYTYSHEYGALLERSDGKFVIMGGLDYSDFNRPDFYPSVEIFALYAKTATHPITPPDLSLDDLNNVDENAGIPQGYFLSKNYDHSFSFSMGIQVVSQAQYDGMSHDPSMIYIIVG